MMLRERDVGRSRAMLPGFEGGPLGPSVDRLFQFPYTDSSNQIQMISFPRPYSVFGSHGVSWRKYPINDGVL